MSLSKTNAWVAGTVAVCLVLALAAWFLLIAPKRAEAAETREQTAAAQAANAQLELKIAELQAQFAELPQRQAELAAIKQAMPEHALLPTLVRALDDKADAAGVTLMSLTPSAPVAVVAADAAAVALAPAEAATDTTTSTPAGEAAAPEVAAPSPDILAAVPVSISVVGNFFNVKAFLESVQTELSRDYLVQGLSIVAETEAEASGGKPAVKNGDVTMTITGSVFVLRPQDSVVPAAAADTTTSNN